MKVSRPEKGRFSNQSNSLGYNGLILTLCMERLCCKKHWVEKRTVLRTNNARILKVGQIKDDFRLWVQVTGTMVVLSMVIQKGGSERD